MRKCHLTHRYGDTGYVHVVVEMWRNSSLSDIYSSLPPPEQSSWRFSDGTYTIDWESSEVQQKIQRSIDFLLKGCSCKKGCKTHICGCRKKNSFCGPGCLCLGCTNVRTDNSRNSRDNSNFESDNSSSSSDNDFDVDSDDDTLQTEVVTDDFEISELV